MTTCEATTLSPESATDIKPVRLLCVDDDPQIQTSLELRFRDYHVAFDHAYYGMQGVVEALKNCPDAIILDISMPNGNGLYLLECLKRRNETAGIPVIIMTGMRDPAVEAEAFALGADAYLTKPAEFTEIVREISRFVELKETA